MLFVSVLIKRKSVFLKCSNLNFVSYNIMYIRVYFRTKQILFCTIINVNRIETLL